MAKHAVLSPSSAKRWMSCPGSVFLSEGIEEESSSFADEGTAAHFLAAETLLSDLNASDFVGGAVSLRCTPEGVHYECWEGAERTDTVLNSFTVTDEMAEYVQVYADLVRDVVAATSGELFIEVPVPIDHLTGEEGAMGTSDAVIIAGDEIIVIDLKYGRGVEVSAIENEQLMFYAAGAAKAFEHVGEFSSVRMIISQPRVSSAPSEWACDRETLKNFEWRVEDSASHVHRLTQDDAELALYPSEDACKWCKAKAKCPKLAEKVQEEIGAEFENLLLSPSPVANVPPLNDETLSTRMACIDLIEDWCKAIRAEVEKRLLAGGEVPGYKLVQGRRGARAWSSAERAEEMLKAMRLKKEEMYDYKLISPTTAEKVLADTPKRWEKVQQLITQSEGKPSVVPVTDKRPAITVTPTADDFDKV